MAFEKEINNYFTGKVKDFALAAVKKFPEEFLTAPASTTGKNHPVDERVEGGMVLHTKRMMWACNEMARALNLSEDQKQLFILAGLLHDSLSKGYVNGELKTLDYHELTPRKYFRYTGGLLPSEYNFVMDLVESHAGIWSPHEKFIPKEDELIKWAFHFCDYLITRREILINL